MKQFLEEVLQNIENFWWTENDAISQMQSCLGAKSSDHVVFIINKDATIATIEPTVYDGFDFKRMADKHVSFTTEEGQLINDIFEASRRHLIASSRNEDTKQENRYEELVSNSEAIIRKYFA